MCHAKKMLSEAKKEIDQCSENIDIAWREVEAAMVILARKKHL